MLLSSLWRDARWRAASENARAFLAAVMFWAADTGERTFAPSQVSLFEPSQARARKAIAELLKAGLLVEGPDGISVGAFGPLSDVQERPSRPAPDSAVRPSRADGYSTNPDAVRKRLKREAARMSGHETDRCPDTNPDTADKCPDIVADMSGHCPDADLLSLSSSLSSEKPEEKEIPEVTSSSLSLSSGSSLSSETLPGLDRARADADMSGDKVKMSGSRKRRARTGMSEDWTPSEEFVRKTSESMNLRRADILGAVPKFRLYYIANGELMASWEACFRNWLTNSVEWKQLIPMATKRPAPPAQATLPLSAPTPTQPSNQQTRETFKVMPEEKLRAMSQQEASDFFMSLVADLPPLPEGFVESLEPPKPPPPPPIDPELVARTEQFYKDVCKIARDEYEASPIAKLTKQWAEEKKGTIYESYEAWQRIMAERAAMAEHQEEAS